MSVNVTMKVNGQSVSATIEASMTLVEFIREHLRLTGTHVGCNTSQCGACTVHINGRAVKSCSLLVAQAQGAEVLTIEGLAAANGDMHPMQAAFKEHHGLQCGFCTPGMVMSACELKGKLVDPTDEQIRASIDGNICRCTGYQNIVTSVKAGLAAMA
ncbi:MAG: (2Fe-2S)-binding protein [Rhizobacter sp.]|nr:(2Fe-2S)-binding protein [Burkholderiales bacterium]